MDNFMDKLVERINAQGSSRAQSMAAEAKMGSRESKEQAEALAAFEQKLAKSFAEDVTGAVNESNAKFVEMLSQYKRENDEGRLSATEEMMAAQASAREAMLEKYDELSKKIIDELSDVMHKESVKCYRNTQAVVEDTQTKTVEGVAEKVGGKSDKGIKGLLIAAIVLLGLNLAGITTILLWIFRVI